MENGGSGKIRRARPSSRIRLDGCTEATEDLNLHVFERSWFLCFPSLSYRISQSGGFDDMQNHSSPVILGRYSRTFSCAELSLSS